MLIALLIAIICLLLFMLSEWKKHTKEIHNIQESIAKNSLKILEYTNPLDSHFIVATKWQIQHWKQVCKNHEDEYERIAKETGILTIGDTKSTLTRMKLSGEKLDKLKPAIDKMVHESTWALKANNAWVSLMQLNIDVSLGKIGLKEARDKASDCEPNLSDLDEIRTIVDEWLSRLQHQYNEITV